MVKIYENKWNCSHEMTVIILGAVLFALFSIYIHHESVLIGLFV